MKRSQPSKDINDIRRKLHTFKVCELKFALFPFTNISGLKKLELVTLANRFIDDLSNENRNKFLDRVNEVQINTTISKTNNMFQQQGPTEPKKQHLDPHFLPNPLASTSKSAQFSVYPNRSAQYTLDQFTDKQLQDMVNNHEYN